MLALNFQNLHQIYKFNRQHGLSATDLENISSQFVKYRDLIKSRQQGFVGLPKQTDVVKRIETYVQQITGKFEHFVILGIGGSMLGPKTIVEALAGRNAKSKITCLENIDPYGTENLAKRLKYGKTLFLVQTKSGGTPETIAQYLYFKEKVSQAGLDWAQHFVFVTDPEKGWLRQIAQAEKVQTFEIPENVGGRFSVLTPVGLLISGLLGLDIGQMLKGAEDIVKAEYEEGSSLNALKLAGVSFLLNQKGKTNVVIMPYNSRLATFSDWCIQLISESTGKQYDLHGQEVNAGLTPIPSLGATDQHSQLQLFKEGPNDKQIFFIETKDYQAKAPIPWQDLAGNPSLSYLSGQSFASLIQAEFAGTRQSLIESLRPNVTLTIDKTDEYHLGALFMLFELYTAYLGEMLEINTFDQPGVERSKVLTKEILGGK